ncbi:MAG: A/G-specific adenine glycosylase [Gammaproteobacteria bacterium]|nr:A/G-specific adenine glycosylase [Gammaproteobacteria bacterium]MDE1983395.1 A/G-specific adenine glycosylase [Gammaproteobacteria bacterium]MDE2107799.1 A/G-specific adenine glycosylase [Gammaproteobacteria bacterium]MDE2461364.1 A/G-specific adenine glycosylase [Gammaproteobacteria bacterium]
MPRLRKPADSKLAPALLRWYRGHGRHDLPWQRRPTPYRVWVSEIMLQQTQVATVKDYYRRFLASFPNVRALADAPLDDVLHLWSGLGYYARARNLHKAALIIREEYSGRFPNKFEQVAALPGIGRSTAGAILALARGERHAILDGNVKRVLARFHAIKGWPGEKKIENKLWVLAEQHTPRKNIAAYTQAIMDLGATLCTRTRPHCGKCPLASGCRAHALGRETAFPSPRPKKTQPIRHTRMLLITCNDRVLLERRPPAGVWGGLWSLPEISPRANAADWCQQQFGVAPSSRQRWPVLRHSFSHFHLGIEPLWLKIAADTRIGDNADRHWVAFAREPALGLATPVKKLLKQLRTLHEESRNDARGQMRLAG